MNLNKKKSGSFPGGKVCLYSLYSLFKDRHTFTHREVCAHV